MEKQKQVLFFLVAFMLFALDIGCTYTTFAVKGVPIAYEVNTIFRDWVIRDGWAVSVMKFVVLKTILFGLSGWLIFKTQSKIMAFIFAQCAISNHLVAISSHPTLWWMDNLELRTILLWAVALFSLLLTYFGIRYLRISGVEASAPQPAPVAELAILERE
ncbi:MAG: hypothetical protein DMG06_29140 [Acidobacteria bacterium]|nr:MAG: hypothetical protein DMG06_29140 [Acidobacteriota bacterium]